MEAAELKEMLLSPQAVILYEVVIAAALSVAVAILSWKRRKRKKQQEMMRVRQEAESLDYALVNRKRRNEG